MRIMFNIAKILKVEKIWVMLRVEIYALAPRLPHSTYVLAAKPKREE
jgi:hypothetical protein